MHNFDAVSSASEMLAYLLGDQNGAMLAARATKSYGQIALPFVDVVRKKIHQQIGDARDELLRLRERPDVFGDSGMSPRQRTKLRHEVRIGQKAYIEYEIRILWHSLAKTEADAGDQNTFLRRLLVKALFDVCAQFVNVEFRSVDHEVSDAADRAQVAPLFLQSRFHRRVDTQRMRAAGLAEASQQHRIGGFEKDDLSRKNALDRLQNPGQLAQFGPFSNVDDQSSTTNLPRLHGQLREAWDQLDWQVIDAVVTKVLEGFQNGCLSGPAHPGDDDKLRGTPHSADFLFRAVPGTDRGLASLHAMDSSIEGRAALPCAIAA